jgi:putative ABC transport system permease protein
MTVLRTLRALRRQPYTTISAIVGIGITMTLGGSVFAIVRGVLLRPLPYSKSEELVTLWTENRRSPATPAVLDLVDSEYVKAFQGRLHGLQDLAALRVSSQDVTATIDLVGTESVLRTQAAYATPNTFDLLGVRATLGQTFSPAAADRDTAIISNALWRGWFGGRPSIVGTSVRALVGGGRESRMLRIGGVLPADVHLTYPRETEIYLPLAWEDVARTPVGSREYQVIGRLRLGVSQNELLAETQGVAATLVADHPSEAYRQDLVIRFETLREHVTRGTRSALVILFVMSMFCLVVASSNIAILLMTRTKGRALEFATRLALGGTSGAISRQLMAEGFVLCCVGAVVGVGGTIVARGWLQLNVPLSLPRGAEASIDWWVLCAMAVTLLLMWLGTSAVPTLYATRSNVGLIASGWRATDPANRAVGRSVVVAIQVGALSALLVVTGLLARSLMEIRDVPLGFNPQGVLTVQMRFLGRRYRDPDAIRQIQAQLHDRLQQLPGISAVGMTSAVPLAGGTEWMARVGTSETHRHSSIGVMTNDREVDPDYFAVMQIPVLLGRGFDSRDTAGTPRVAIVSKGLAAILYPGRSPIGETLYSDVPLEIIGVVGDVRALRLDISPAHAYYVPQDQEPRELVNLVIRTSRAESAVIRQIPAAIRSADPEQPILRIESESQIMSLMMAERSFYSVMTTMCAGLALGLAALGMYGVMAQRIRERSKEFSIRMALGCRRSGIVRMAVRQLLAPVAIGITAGFTIALILARVHADLLFNVSPSDHLVYGVTGFLIAVVSAISVYVPLRRILASQALSVLVHEQ